MANNKDKPTTPEGKKGKIPTGGKAGRTPGLGTRNHSGTTSGGVGRNRPTQGYGLVAGRKPPEKFRPKPQTKPKDEKDKP